MIYTELIKVVLLAFIAFGVVFLLTPLYIRYSRKNGFGKNIRQNGDTPHFSHLHASKSGTPNMGGALISGCLLGLMGFFYFLSKYTNWQIFDTLNFFSRRETLLPLGAFLGASTIGLIDDYMDLKRKGINGTGLRFRFKVWLYIAVALIGALWFYFKLDFTVVHIPFFRDVDLLWWFIPFFIFVVVATGFSVNQTDGLDGLAGGSLLIVMVVFSSIAFLQGKNDLSAFLAVVSGGLLAFLWFNIHPAEIFMGDTGSMGMGALIAVVAFLTNTVFLIPIFGFLFVIEAVSTLWQLFYRKVFKKKFFLSSPLHHHLEVVGWPEGKIIMRLWIISAVAALFGITLYFTIF